MTQPIKGVSWKICVTVAGSSNLSYYFFVNEMEMVCVISSSRGGGREVGIKQKSW